MFTKSRLFVIMACAGTAGAVTCSVASADELSLGDDRHVPFKTLNDTVPWRHRATSDSTFDDRAVNAIVYDNSSLVFAHNNLSIGLCSHILEDISFNPGPYGSSYVGTRTLTYFSYALGVSGSSAVFDLRFSFYRPSDAVFTGFSGPGTSMINPNATPYYVLTIQRNEPCPGFTSSSGFVLLPTPALVPSGESGLWLDAAMVEPGTPSSAPLSATNLFQANKTTTRAYFIFGSNSQVAGPSFTGPQTPAALAAAANPASIGYSTVMYGRDINFDGIFTGQATATTSGSNELRYATSGGLSGQSAGYGLICAFAGQVPSPSAPPATSLNGGNGFLADGQTPISDTLTTASKFKWYRFNTANDINYAQTTFLDIDTEGSAVPTSFALYSPDSTIYDVSSGRGDGPDNARPSDLDNQQLSFGVARRPGVGSGEQYAGQEGNLPAGEYYLAVALAGSGFGDGWLIQPEDPVSPKSFTLNFNTNNQKTFAAPAAVSPALASGADIGILTGGPQSTPDQAIRARSVGFVRFSLTNPLPTTGQFDQSDNSPLSDVTYMDITQPGSSVVGEWNFALYNNNGTLANGSSISYAGTGFNGNPLGGDGAWGCGGTFAQLSYGTAASRGPTPLDPDQNTLGHPLDNQNGATLGGDQYYLAVTMGDALFANERWGARSTRGSSLTAVITVTSDNRGPSVGCPADFNGDGGVDDADFAFFAKYYGDLINVAGDIDGSSDGMTDDGDFSVFASAYDALVCF
ncbi:MAG: hypothetical protein JNK16_02045 [Phycisphaerales bacterium]|nr:hypothetical protein [Phycisphaerales bacterium]